MDLEEDSTWTGDFIKMTLENGSRFDCEIQDLIVKNGTISEFDCQYSGNQQVFV